MLLGSAVCLCFLEMMRLVYYPVDREATVGISEFTGLQSHPKRILVPLEDSKNYKEIFILPFCIT